MLVKHLLLRILLQKRFSFPKMCLLQVAFANGKAFVRRRKCKWINHELEINVAKSSTISVVILLPTIEAIENGDVLLVCDALCWRYLLALTNWCSTVWFYCDGKRNKKKILLVSSWWAFIFSVVFHVVSNTFYCLLRRNSSHVDEMVATTCSNWWQSFLLELFFHFFF